MYEARVKCFGLTAVYKMSIMSVNIVVWTEAMLLEFMHLVPIQ